MSKIYKTARGKMIDIDKIKLANEQARYEIAFREDLAVLAENLRKPKV